MPGPPPVLHAVTGSSSGEEEAQEEYVPASAAGARPTRERKQTVREDFASSFDSAAEESDSGSGSDSSSESGPVYWGPKSRRPAKFAQKAAKVDSAKPPRKRPAPVQLEPVSSSSDDSSGEESSGDSSPSDEPRAGGASSGAGAAAAADGSFHRTGGVKTKVPPQRIGGKLNRNTAASVATHWYNNQGPFAGQYTMLKPIEAYRNTETAWSLKYFTQPDAGGLFFVRFEYMRDSNGMWTVEQFALYEPSELDESIESDSSEAEEAEGGDDSEEEPDWRDSESQGAKKRRLQKAMMKSAKAERAKGSKKSQAAKKQKHADIERDKGQMAKARMAFLMKQADVFGQFLGKAAMRKGNSKTPSSPSKRHRMTEQEEDGDYAKQQKLAAVEQAIPRLTPEMTAAFIQFGKMRDYQVEGLNWMIRLYHRGLNGILADEMGLGKTLQTISMLAYLYTYKDIKGPHLVTVPKSTLGNWEREFGRWFPKLKLLKFYGNKEERALQRTRDLVYGKFDVLLTTYEMVITEKGSLGQFAWEFLIIDEAHRIKNEESTLGQIVRMYNTKCRLLVTGTPLQNNLHELWALLNFLLPDVFSDSSMFEKYSNAEGEEKDVLIRQLHRVLQPFILRRLKVEVEKGLPAKKELVVYCDMTASQRQAYQAVLKNNVEVLNTNVKERTKLMNVVMQLRKACNHPYLFDGLEDKTLDPFGEHLVNKSGKLLLLDKLLPRLKAQGSRVLIFSQMTRILDILEDYCFMRRFARCRIDGNTSSEDRDRMIDAYNAPDSQYFIFLLSTRAGGLGITLTSADVVVLYDSDWNPQMDLQAQDRAHRIGQKKPVKVFRLIAEHTIEEKILDRAMKKLHLDALVIQQGRLANNDEKGSGTSKDEMMAAVRYGADGMFNASEVGEDGSKEIDIDAILAKAETKTAEMNSKYEAAKSEGEGSSLWKFDGSEQDAAEADKAKQLAMKLQDEALAMSQQDMGKRVRKQTQKFGTTGSPLSGDENVFEDDPDDDPDATGGGDEDSSDEGYSTHGGKKKKKKKRKAVHSPDFVPDGARDGGGGGAREPKLKMLVVADTRNLPPIADTVPGRWQHMLVGIGAANFGDRRLISRTDVSELRRHLWTHRGLIVPPAFDKQSIKRDPSQDRVAIWNAAEKRKIVGSAAPTKSNLKKYLAKHKGWEVYTGQDNAAAAAAGAAVAAVAAGATDSKSSGSGGGGVGGAGPERTKAQAALLQTALCELLVYCAPTPDIAAVVETVRAHSAVIPADGSAPIPPGATAFSAAVDNGGSAATAAAPVPALPPSEAATGGDDQPAAVAATAASPSTLPPGVSLPPGVGGHAAAAVSKPPPGVASAAAAAAPAPAPAVRSPLKIKLKLTTPSPANSGDSSSGGGGGGGDGSKLVLTLPPAPKLASDLVGKGDRKLHAGTFIRGLSRGDQNSGWLLVEAVEFAGDWEDAGQQKKGVPCWVHKSSVNLRGRSQRLRTLEEIAAEVAQRFPAPPPVKKIPKKSDTAASAGAGAAVAAAKGAAAGVSAEKAASFLHDYLRSIALAPSTSKRQQEIVLLACDLLRGKVETTEKRVDAVPVPKAMMKTAFHWALPQVEMHRLSSQGEEKFYSKRVLIQIMATHMELREIYTRRWMDKKQYLSSWAKASLSQCMSIEIESNFLRWLEKDKDHNQKTNPCPNYIQMLKKDDPISTQLNAIMRKLNKKECMHWYRNLSAEATGKVIRHSE